MIDQDWEAIRRTLERGEPASFGTDSGTTMQLVPAPAPGIALDVEETDTEGSLVSRTRFYDAATDRPVDYLASIPFLSALPVTVIERRGPPAVAICMFGMTVHGNTVLDAEACMEQAAELVSQSVADGWKLGQDTGEEPAPAFSRWLFEKGSGTRSILAMTVPRTALIMFDEPGS